MNSLLLVIAAQWEKCLREILLQRGHAFSVINDFREIAAALEQTDYSLAFVGTGGSNEETIEICRQLRACSGAKPLEILACGGGLKRDEIRALISAGVDDFLSDPNNKAEIELRLALAEFRVSRRSDSAAIQPPCVGQNNNGVSFKEAPKGFFRSSLEGKVIEADQCLVEMLGYKSREELMRIDIARDFYIDPLIRLKLLTELSTGHKTHEFFCKHRDGRPIAIRMNFGRVFDDAGNFLYFEGTIQDISASIKDPNLLRIQYNLALQLSNTFELRTTLNEVLNAAMQIEGVDCGGIYLFNDSSRKFELAASIRLPDWFIQSVSQYDLDEPQMQYMMQGKPLYLSTKMIRHSSRPAFEKAGIIGGAIAPITYQERVIGTLNLASHTHKTILHSARRAIEAITLQIGGSVARAQTESARQIGRQNLQSLFDTLQDMIFVLDMTGRLLYANHMVGKRLGYMPAELSNMEVADFHPPQRRQEVVDLFTKLVTGEASVCDIPLLAKDGTQIPVEIVVARGKWGETEAVFGIARDLSERQYARLALYESESRFRAIFESAAIGLALGNLQGMMLVVNGTFAKMLGYMPEELVGKRYSEYTHPDDVGSQQTLLEELFEDKHDKILLEKRYIHKDGGIIWGRLNISLIRDAEGVPLYGIGIIENITEQKQSAEAIQKEQQLLRRIIDLHERDRQITAYEIHDGIAQQVTASKFHLEAFQRLRDSDAKAAEKSLEIALKLISQSMDETRRLISGLRPLILDEYGIVEAIDYLVCENRERSGMQIDFHHDVRFKRLVPPLESAAFRIVQEAVANACRHSRSPGVIVELIQRDDRLHIKVQDQGVGFDPNAVEETRFGLRSIRERARLLGGRAEIQSAPGSGTSISVELPVVLRADEET
jgi:PAS domain S-box-containing protein